MKYAVEALNNKIDKIRELLINEQISPEDYGVIKKQLEEKIYNLKKNLNSFHKKQDDLNNPYQKFIEHPFKHREGVF